MDLTRFTGNNDSKKEPQKTLIDDEQVTKIKKGDNIEWTIKSKEGLATYQDELLFSPSNATVVNSEQEAKEFFESSLKEGTEGVMVKNLEAPYKSGLRSGAMAKLKEVKEDIDVVILGAEYGTGKRAGYFSSFLVGVLDEEAPYEEQRYLTIGKVSSGVKELGEEGISLEYLNQQLKPHLRKTEQNTVWFTPQVVIEIRYQEIQESTTYEGGYALRFPRIIRLREDKPVNEINTIQYIKDIVSQAKEETS